MTLYVPQGQDFQWYYSNTLATQPTAAYGATITPTTTAGSFGAWTQLASAANIPYDVYGVQICFNSGATSAANRLTFVNIGYDPAGGTTYTVKIPYLMASKAYPYNVAPSGIWYYFPIFIPAGSSIAAQATSSVATTFNCSAYFYGRPRKPEAIRVGHYVDVFGLNTTTRAGTAMTGGTTAEGAFSASLGTTSKHYWWWQAGLGSETTTVNGGMYHMDLIGGASTTAGNYKFLLENQVWFSTTAEQVGCLPLSQNCYSNLAPGQNLYARLQGTVAGTSMTAVAYGLGG